MRLNCHRRTRYLSDQRNAQEYREEYPCNRKQHKATRKVKATAPGWTVSLGGVIRGQSHAERLVAVSGPVLRRLQGLLRKVWLSGFGGLVLLRACCGKGGRGRVRGYRIDYSASCDGKDVRSHPVMCGRSFTHNEYSSKQITIYNFPAFAPLFL